VTEAEDRKLRIEVESARSVVVALAVDEGSMKPDCGCDEGAGVRRVRKVLRRVVEIRSNIRVFRYGIRANKDAGSGCL
jgi:hypothetical protein